MAPSATGLVGVHGFDLARDAAVELQVLVCGVYPQRGRTDRQLLEMRKLTPPPTCIMCMYIRTTCTSDVSDVVGC
jgi:hypothetical protein